MEELLLKEKQILPSHEVLETTLGGVYSVYDALVRIVKNGDFGLVPEWNYYNDGKAWLCKVVNKKKTVFWLSVWSNGFKTSFYFTEKTVGGLLDLPIDPALKEQVLHAKLIGKLIPLTFYISRFEQLDDLIQVIKYKMELR